LNPAMVTNKYYNKKKRQVRLSVFLFVVFSKRISKDAKQSFVVRFVTQINFFLNAKFA